MSNVYPIREGQDAAGFPTISLANPQLEQALLGLLLVKPQFLDELPAGFSADFYHDQFHAEIHRALVAVGRPGIPAAIVVIEALGVTDPERRGYIASLITVPVGYMPGMACSYAEALAQNYRRRQIAALAGEMRDAAYGTGGDETADVAIAAAMSRLEAMTNGSAKGNRDTTALTAAMDGALRKADEASSRNGPAGLSTGLPSVDAKLGGMDDGQLIVLAGRPGSGKTSLGIEIALHNARQGIGVLVISQEMTADELGRRVLCAVSGVPVWALKQGKHGPYADRLREARKVLDGLPMSIEDEGGMRAAVIAMKARKAHRAHGLGLIVVDHLHITPPDATDAKHGPTYGVGQVSGAMKRLAKAMGVPVLLLAQLNRNLENRDDKRPVLADLRQSGDIEADADAVAFLYRAEMYMLHEPERAPGEGQEKFANKLAEWRRDKATAQGKAELILAKVRDGEVGSVPLEFHGETTSFSEVGQ